MLECLFRVTKFYHRNHLSTGEADHIYVAAALAQAPTAPSPRGVKRSRSPDQLEESWVGADDDGTYGLLRDGFTVSTRTTSIYHRENILSIVA